MEDSVTETEKLQVLTSVDDGYEKKGGANQVINNGEDVEDKDKAAVGFINHLISSFTPGGGKEEEEKQVKDERDFNGGDHVVEEKPVGLINQIISSFAPEDKEQEKVDNKVSSVESEGTQEENKGGGGLFSHIMSNLVSSPLSSPRARAENQAGDDLFDNPKTPEKDGNGIIDNIVSNLPPPLPDDAAPASDEASILIHSIIHD